MAVFYQNLTTFLLANIALTMFKEISAVEVDLQHSQKNSLCKNGPLVEEDKGVNVALGHLAGKPFINLIFSS